MKNSFLITFIILLISSGFMLGCGTTLLSNTAKTDYDTIVIGAGMGGLSSGVHLAAEGMKVLVLEQHYKVGGCTSSFTRGEFGFDTALHEMSLGGGTGFVRDLLRKAGVLDKIELIRVPQIGRSIFPDGLDFVSPDGFEEFKISLQKRFPHEKNNIEIYFEFLDKMAAEVAELRDVYFANPLKALLTKLTVPLHQRTLTKYRNKTVQEAMDDFFEDKQLKAVLTQFWYYYGPPPADLWSIIFFVAQQSYAKNGGWQIKGSSSALSEAYAQRIKELGGIIKTSTKVTKILHEKGSVTGVETENGDTYTSKFVVAAIDPYQTFFKLLGEKHTPRKIKKQLKSWQPSNSLAGVFLGLDVPASFWGIEEYEIFYNTSYDNEAMYQAMMEQRWSEGMVSLTVYSNLDDPFYAPEGKTNLVLNAYSDYSSWSEDPKEYEKQKQRMVDELIDLAQNVMPNLREHIIVQEGMTPRTINHYTLQYKGVPYGMNFTVDQQDRVDMATDIGGLYLTGSWFFPAHSVGMAQASGYLTSQIIIQKNEDLK